VKVVPCPRCGTQAPYAPENPWRPFCTERCRMIDLGNWASEAYRMPVPIEPPADAEPGEK
jgi:hypothetical protein